MIFNGHGECLSVNPWGIEHMKIGGDMVGKHFLDIWHPEFKAEAQRGMTTVLEGNHSTFEAVRYDGDGLAWWSVKLQPVVDSYDNRSAGFVLFGSDISEEKQTKTRLDSLRNAEQRYLELENIFNAMLDPVHITNRDYEIEFVNRACREVFGYHTPGTKCYSYFHNFESPCEWCRHEEVLMGKSYHTENYCEKTQTYFDANHSPLAKTNGDIAKVVILRDITKRKKAEEDLLATKQALVEAQRIAHLGHWDLDLQTGKGKWSDESYRIFGFEPGAFEPTFNKFIDSVHPGDRKAVEAYFPDLLSGKPSRVEIDLRIIRPSGEERIINVKLEVITDENGKPFKLNGISLDITERKRAEEERERLIKELRDAIAQVKTLSGMLPICSSCKKIRDDQGYWNQIEVYISEHSQTAFSHSICPECAKKLYPEYYDNIWRKNDKKE
jgi:PAS domain S-box-containing protein